MAQLLMMRDILSPKSVSARIEAQTKKDVLIAAAKIASDSMGRDNLSVFDVLWERERLGTTGVGQGIAIPHGRIDGLDKVYGFFIRLAEPIAFEAIDDRPVDLVFVLLAPADAGADHLHALATVSRLLRDQKLCEAIRKADSSEAIYRLLTETPAAQAA